MDLGIDGKTALITGAAGGMGEATARRLLEAGCRVVLTDRDEAGLKKTVDELGGAVQTVIADLATARGVLDLAAATVKLDTGEPDLVIHTAGVTGEKGDPLTISEDGWEEAIQIDLMSAVRVARAFVPAMTHRGWGRVVFVTSENAAQPYPDEVCYNVAKAGVLAFSKSLSIGCAQQGVNVNAVSPAFIATDMTDGMMKKRAEELGVSFDEAIESFLKEDRPHLELQRRGRADEVAAVIAFLCSQSASFVIGSNYRVDGGSVLSVNL